MQRALALDEAWELGSLHDFFITWEGGTVLGRRLAATRRREHFERAVALSDGQRVSPYVT